MRILLVESDLQAAAILSQILRTAAFTVDHTASGEEAIEMLRHYDYDVMVLELLLNDIEGYDVIRRIRSSRLTTPIPVLATLLPTQAKLLTFCMGPAADMAQPYAPGEHNPPHHAVMRRARGLTEPCLRAGNQELDLTAP